MTYEMQQGFGKYLLAILLASTCSVCEAQNDPHSTAIYKSVPGIQVVSGDSAKDKIGIYELGGSMSGYILTLDSNMRFKIGSHSCMDLSIRDSGTWLVFKTGRIGLRCRSGTQKTFDLLKFDHYYFGIAPGERAQFVKDYLELSSRFKDEKPVRRDGQGLTPQDLVAHCVMNDFYMRDLNVP